MAERHPLFNALALSTYGYCVSLKHSSQLSPDSLSKEEQSFLKIPEGKTLNIKMRFKRLIYAKHVFQFCFKIHFHVQKCH